MPPGEGERVATINWKSFNSNFSPISLHSSHNLLSHAACSKTERIYYRILYSDTHINDSIEAAPSVCSCGTRNSEFMGAMV